MPWRNMHMAFWGDMTKRIYKLFLFLLLTGGACVSLRAQLTADASLTGVIKDSTGGVIPNARVKLENPTTGGGRATLSDSQGQYRFDLVAPGTYKLTVPVAG